MEGGKKKVREREREGTGLKIEGVLTATGL